MCGRAMRFGVLALRFYLCAYLAIGWHIPSVLAQGAPSEEFNPNPNESPAEQARTIVAAIDHLEETLRSHEIPPSNPEAVLALTGRDYERIFAWVRDETALVPYSGSLRGSDGVLDDRDGNSLDRALLLSSLLEEAGHETRLARGRLDQDQARQMAMEPRGPPPLQTFSGLNSALDPDIQGSLDDIFERIETQSLDLIDVTANYRAAPDVIQQSAVDEAQISFADHWWVQVKDRSGWIDLDPTLSAPNETRITAGSYHSAQNLPPEDLHRVKIRLVLELWHGQSYREETLVELELPAREFAGKSLHVSHVPLGIEPEEIDLDGPDVSAALRKFAAAPAWLPLLSFDGNLMRMRLVTSEGEIKDATDETLSGYRDGTGLDAMGGAVEQKMGSLDILAGATFGDSPAAASTPEPAESKPPFQTVTAEWLEYVIVAPNKPASVLRRTLFDVVGPERRQSGHGPEPNGDQSALHQKIAGFLAGNHIAVETRKLMPHRFLSRVVRKLGDFRPYFWDIASSGDVAQEPSEEYMSLLRSMQIDLDALAVYRWQLNWGSQGVFVNQPNISALQTFAKTQPSGEVQIRRLIDIVRNEVGVRHLPGLDPYETRVTQGVADTVLEAALVGSPTLLTNVSLLHAKARELDGMLSVLAREEVASQNDIPADPKYGREIFSSLKSGQLIVLPRLASQPLAFAELTWWRIDPTTGDTLGIGPSSAGQSWVTQTLRLLGALLFVAGTYFYLDCVAGNQESAFFGAVSLKGAGWWKRYEICSTEFLTFELIGVTIAKLFSTLRMFRFGTRGGSRVAGAAAGHGDDAGRIAGRVGDGAGHAASGGDDAGRIAGRVGDGAGHAAGGGDDAGRIAGRVDDTAPAARAGDEVAEAGPRGGVDDATGGGGKGAGSGGGAGGESGGGGGDRYVTPDDPASVRRWENEKLPKIRESVSDREREEIARLFEEPRKIEDPRLAEMAQEIEDLFKTEQKAARAKEIADQAYQEFKQIAKEDPLLGAKTLDEMYLNGELQKIAADTIDAMSSGSVGPSTAAEVFVKFIIRRIYKKN